MKTWAGIGAVIGAVVASAVLFVGCEDAPEAGTAVLTITPARAEIQPLATIQFTVNGVTGATGNVEQPYLPLRWSVSDNAIGVIADATGLTAVYQAADARGNNTVTVRDKADRTASAVVVQN